VAPLTHAVDKNLESIKLQSLYQVVRVRLEDLGEGLPREERHGAPIDLIVGHHHLILKIFLG
jgi:hypothetical protein